MLLLQKNGYTKSALNINKASEKLTAFAPNTTGIPYGKNIDLNMLEIRNPDYKSFRSIKKFDPEAYFYWYKSISIISGN